MVNIVVRQDFGLEFLAKAKPLRPRPRPRTKQHCVCRENSTLQYI